MRDLGASFLSLLRDERGATAIEYGILATMIGVALIGMTSLGGVAERQADLYNNIAGKLR